MTRHFQIAALSLSVLFLAAMAGGAVIQSIRGIVHDPDHRPIPGAHVVIRAVASDWSKSAETDSGGEFVFPALAIGAYDVSITAGGFSPATQRLVVTSAGVPILHLQMRLAVITQSVEASETALEIQPAPAALTTLVGRNQIERTPGAARTNSLAMITDFVPGAYMVHDQLHIRGGHQVTWMVDGVPVPNTNIASNAGPQFDPKDADYIEVQRGGYSAEYGDRTYGVFNVVPRTGFERSNQGELIAGFGSARQTDDQINFGNHTERFAWYTSFNANRTDLALEPPGPALLHDQGSGYGGFGTLVWNIDPADQLRLIASLRRDQYQVPNTPEQQAAGVRDGEEEADAFVNFSWIHTAGKGVLLTVSPFYHINRANYAGVPGALDDRSSSYAGAQTSISAVTRSHDARAGVYGFAQRDETIFGLDFRQTQHVTGHLEALFFDDQYKLTPWLTLGGGVRLTHFSGSLSENAASPRASVAIRIPRWNWVFHGYYGRFYQAPPLSTVTGPLLAFASDRGFGFLPLHGERDEQLQFGASIPLRGWTLDLDRFRTRAKNYFDHNALGNSNIFFPLTIEGARIRGWEAALRSPLVLRKARLHLAYSRQVAEGLGAVTGGLTDFSPPDGRFLLDHDQRHTLNAGLDANLPFQAWMATNVYYGSGFADAGGPLHLAGHTTMDLTVGKAVRENWSVSLTALNLANRRYLLDNSPTFGGTHYAEPRQIFGQLKYRFRL